MKLIFASSNKNKVSEIKKMIPNMEIFSLKDINFNEEIPETMDTIEGNAIQKVNFLKSKLNMDCFSDDTGLEVEALNGLPGVKTARFAGENCSNEDNIKKLLLQINGKTNRTARFKTIICLNLSNKQYLFEGIVNGTISKKIIGEKGFGYDPIFIPNGHKKTFAEMTMEDKNKISHRALALNKFINFFKQK